MGLFYCFIRWCIGMYEGCSVRNIIISHCASLILYLEALAKILYPMMKVWRIIWMKAVITGGKRRAPEGTWVPGGGIELPCTYYIYAAKTHKNYIRNKIKEAEKISSETKHSLFSISPFPRCAYLRVRLSTGALINGNKILVNILCTLQRVRL